jgi:predicted membrane GTPase involved in stress response
MRREGYELTVGQPQVIVKEIDGKKCEPYETLVVDVPSEFSGKVIDLVTQRKGEMLIMETKGEIIKSFVEKPSYIYHSNAGIYLFKQKFIKKIPSNQPFDSIDLIDDLIKDEKLLMFRTQYMF